MHVVCLNTPNLAEKKDIVECFIEAPCGLVWNYYLFMFPIMAPSGKETLFILWNLSLISFFETVFYSCTYTTEYSNNNA